MKAIQSVSFVGAGNVATQLALAFFNAGVTIHEVVSKTEENAVTLANKVNAKSVVNASILDKKVDLIVLAISDDAIEEVLSYFEGTACFLVHTSGSVPLTIFEGVVQQYGVIYPLQTFTKTRKIEFEKIPILVEGNTKEHTSLLQELASKISSNVGQMNSEQRKKIHLSAVMVNNFGNHLFHLAHSYCVQQHVDFNLLLPLMKETVAKLEGNIPSNNQTGPAKRNDQKTIQEHQKMLEDHPSMNLLYTFFTADILATYSSD